MPVHPHVCGEIDDASAWCTHVTVHPHVCGEIVAAFCRDAGSRRFTPTCVGKSACDGCTALAVAVHPHVCGEISRQLQPVARAAPVHPHVCGEIVHVGHVADRLHRFTPTCVGKSLRSCRHCCRPTGSPPRVWGNHVHRCAIGVRHAVHPHVCGEIASGSCACTHAIAVHPHVCGEISGQRRPSVRVARFTPTCVGKSAAQLRRPCRRRFTPTCVGKSRAHVDAGDGCGGSPPRVWGNRSPAAVDIGYAAGSPPRVWGNHYAEPPATRCRAVHPHVCGEICSASPCTA